jgi:hypothetical protein
MYEVEWVESVPKDKHGESQLHDAAYGYRRFPSKGLARAFAVKTAQRRDIPFMVASVREYKPISEAQAIDDDESWCERGQWYTWLGEAEHVGKDAR